MIKLSKDEEFKKIELLITLKKEIHIVELNLEYSRIDGKEYLPLLQQHQDISSKIENLTTELQQIDTPNASILIVDCLLSIYEQMKTEINGAVHNFPISRCQSTILENYFVSKIDNEINCVINGNLRGLITPFLYYTIDKADSIERQLIIDFINNEISIIRSYGLVNYILILDYYKGFQQRLRQLIL